MKNDGFTVFRLSPELCTALAQASSGRLVEVAGGWAELAAAKDEGVPAGTTFGILREVAGLALTAEGLSQPLYCWYFAP